MLCATNRPAACHLPQNRSKHRHARVAADAAGGFGKLLQHWAVLFGPPVYIRGAMLCLQGASCLPHPCCVLSTLCETTSVNQEHA